MTTLHKPILLTSNKWLAKYAPKPSDMVNLMCDGLEYYDGYEGFSINFGVFGDTDVSRLICVGCAATAFAQYASGKEYHPVSIADRAGRSETIRMFRTDLFEVENAVDNLRCGYLQPMLILYEMDDEFLWVLPFLDLHLPTMYTHEWRPFLEDYRNLARLLKESGR